MRIGNRNPTTHPINVDCPVVLLPHESQVNPVSRTNNTPCTLFPLQPHYRLANRPYIMPTTSSHLQGFRDYMQVYMRVVTL